MTDLARRRIALALTALCALLIGVFTLQPLAFPGPPGGDKLHHVVAFAALVLPAAFLQPRWAAALLVLALVYGGAIEILQPWVNRSGEWADWLADAAGAVIGVLAGRGLAAFAPWRRG